MPDQLFWGDIHNHCSVGYAKGSLERAYDIARAHLDVFAFTGHAQWHDMPTMEGDRHLVWVNGCRTHEEQWPLVQRLAREHNRPGEFVSFLAYEWHSSEFGDYCVYYRDDDRPLKFFAHVRDLQAWVRESGAMMLPHHPGYAPGWRGINLDWLDPDLSPTCEIFSEHGNAESDDATFPYLRHSQGRQVTAHTLRRIWERGFRVGVTAGTDDHLGYPGAYLEGVTGFWAPELTREAIWDSIRRRRTFGCTGDRIELDFWIDGQPMGAEISAGDSRRIAVKVVAPDRLDVVEVLRNETVIERHHPTDAAREPWTGRGHVRIEYGWGPWLALGLDRICDWRLTARLSGGRILRALPCFQSGPFDEERRNRIESLGADSCTWSGYTSRLKAIGEVPTNAVILEVEAAADARLEVVATEPAEVRVQATIGELADENRIVFTGPFPSESILVHRAIPTPASTAEFELVDHHARPAWYRVRARQTNGQLAWSSPVWVD